CGLACTGGSTACDGGTLRWRAGATCGVAALGNGLASNGGWAACDGSALTLAEERSGRQLRVAHRMLNILDILVPEVVPQGGRFVAVIGEFEPASMAEHVRMHAEWHLRGLPEPRNHSAEADGAHGRSPLAQEQVS